MGSPFKQKKFNLSGQLLKDKIQELKNMPRPTVQAPPMPTSASEMYAITNPQKPSISENFGNATKPMLDKARQLSRDFSMGVATGTNESRLSDSEERAFIDYSARLGDDKFVGEVDQYGMRGGLNGEGQSFVRRDFSVPFSENGSNGNVSRYNSKNYPVLSSYANQAPRQITMNDENPTDPDYLNQQKRREARGLSFNQFDVNTEGQGNYFGTMNPMSTFQNYVGRGGKEGKNKDFKFVSKYANPVGYDKEEQNAIDSMEASNIASQSFNDARNSGSYSNAREIFDNDFEKIRNVVGRYRGTGPNTPEDRSYVGVKGRGNAAGEGRAKDGYQYLDDPGNFYGQRVKDNMEYRIVNANTLYENDYLPTKKEEVDKEAYSKVQALRFKNMMNDFNNKPKFDVKSGMFN